MKTFGWLAVLVGILFIVAGVIYFSTPAHSLPTFFPGYDPALSKIHRTHGIGALGLGILSFVFAWFQTSKKSPQK